MARSPQSITFHVPVSTANLGPGYGVLAIALDLPIVITVEPRSDGEIVVERRDVAAPSVDPRHDPVLRGFRAAAAQFDAPIGKGCTIAVAGTVPRGTGMGTISAGFAAGVSAAVRLSRRKWTPSQVLDCMVPLGGDPAHGAASLVGGCIATAPLNPPREPMRSRIVPLSIHPDWRFVVVMPELPMGTAETKRVLPPTLPHAVAARSTGRVLGLVHGLSEGDPDLVRACLFDEIHVPFRRRLVPGMEAAMAAGIDAGAAGTTISGHGPGLLALALGIDKTPAIAAAMQAAFVSAGRQANSLVLQVAHYGSLPVQTA